MKNVPIQKLNKRLIFICLIGASAIAIPLMILPMACQHSSGKRGHQERVVQALVNNDDVLAISGTENLPASYDAVRQFLQKHPNQKEDMNAAFEKLASIDRAPSRSEAGTGVYQTKDDPWHEAKTEEQRRRAHEHYQSRRAGIMFARDGFAAPNESLREKDPVMGMLEKSLAIAEKNLNPSAGDSSGVFFPRGNGDIGKLKMPLPFTLSEGTLIPAVLQSEINTELPGPILARVTHNIWDSKTGQALLVPQNSTLIGEYRSSVGHGHERAQVVWSRIIFPNQQSVDLGAMVGLDKKGVSGAAGQVDNHYDKIALGLAMTTALGAGVRITQGKYEPNSATMAQEFGNSLAQETMRLGNKITDKMLSVPPTIVVPMGKQLNIFVEQDLALRPYQG